LDFDSAFLAYKTCDTEVQPNFQLSLIMSRDAAAESKKRKASPVRGNSSSKQTADELLPRYPSDVERARSARVGATLSSMLSRVPGISIMDAWKQSLLQTLRECDPVTGYPCPKQSEKDKAATRAAMEAAKLPFKKRGAGSWSPPPPPPPPPSSPSAAAAADAWSFRYPERVLCDVRDRPESPIY
jgi:hypothetical protein